MSGVDEQYKVPQCPACGISHEIRVGSSTWLFPEDARIKRELKYSLYVRCDAVIGDIVPQFSSNEIQCLGCGASFPNGTEYYDKLKPMFNKFVRGREYYDNEPAFEDEDNTDAWGYNDDLSEVVWNT